MKQVREVKGNMKGFCRCFCRYFSSKRKSREIVGLLLDGAGDLEKRNTEMTRVLKTFFTCIQQSQAPRPVGKSRAKWSRVRLRNSYTNWTYRSPW